MSDYNAKILADSLAPNGVRLTTFEVSFPRFILAEFNTHRMLSRNSASSRAIPTEKLLERVQREPFVPNFNKRVKGMGVGEPLDVEASKVATDFWKTARNNAIESVQKLNHLNIDKSRVNRLLEPFMWHTAIVTATEWSNFFALRNSPEAQPEFAIVAALMQELLETRGPEPFANSNQWHLPLVTGQEMEEAALQTLDVDVWWDYWKKVSVGRCARVSYLTHDGQRDPLADIELHDRLKSSGHMSPFEHVARPMHWSDIPWAAGDHDTAKDFCGNFRGWWQYRKDIRHEDDYSKILQEAS